MKKKLKHFLDLDQIDTKTIKALLASGHKLKKKKILKNICIKKF